MKRTTKTIRGGISLKLNDQKDPNQLIKAVFNDNRRSINVVVSISPEAKGPELLVNIGESFEGKMFEFHFPISEEHADIFAQFHRKMDKSSFAEPTIASWLALFTAAIGSRFGGANAKSK